MLIMSNPVNKKVIYEKVEADTNFGSSSIRRIGTLKKVAEGEAD
jgi:hypothetical protein